MAHHIFAGNVRQAEDLAGAFEDDGYTVRWARLRPGSFIELEVSDDAPERDSALLKR